MRNRERAATPMVFWTWGDDAIENPKKVKKTLEALHSTGIKGFLIILKGTRYTLLDKRVIRTISQVSQWSKKREMQFWIHMDPRQASRPIITQTKERLQFLATERSGGGKAVTPLIHPYFEIEYDWSLIKSTPWLQESAISLEPVGLERAFLFQAVEGRIHLPSVHDITAHTSISSNIASRSTSVFGEIHIPSDESWYVTAFPKFATNLYDYAGRESNDYLSTFIEDLFDGCTHLDGIAWAEGGPPAMVPSQYLPVSLSIYNSFKSDLGYDLRDRLYALAFECSDHSHIQVRHDYYNFLNRTMLNARHEFHSMLHSFFPGVHMGANHQQVPAVSAAQRHAGCLDPWRNTLDAQSVFCLIETLGGDWLEALMAKMIFLKSMTNQGRKSLYCSLPWHELNPQEQQMLQDWMIVLGLEIAPLLHNGDDILEKDATFLENVMTQHHRFRIERPNAVLAADVAMVYPLDTLFISDIKAANDKVARFAHWTSSMTKAGYQMDIISPQQLFFAVLEEDGLKIGNNHYQSLIYPFPSILPNSLRPLLESLASRDFPVFFLEESLDLNTQGLKIVTLPIPVISDFKTLEEKLQPLLRPPENALAALHQTDQGWEVMMAPLKAGIPIQGELFIHEKSYKVKTSRSLIRMPIS